MLCEIDEDDDQVHKILKKLEKKDDKFKKLVKKIKKFFKARKDALDCSKVNEKSENPSDLIDFRQIPRVTNVYAKTNRMKHFVSLNRFVSPLN